MNLELSIIIFYIERLLKTKHSKILAQKYLIANVDWVFRIIFSGTFWLVITFLVAIIVDVEPIFHIIRFFVDLSRISIFSVFCFFFLIVYLFLIFCSAVEIFSSIFWIAFNIYSIAFWVQFEGFSIWTVGGK